MTTSTMTAIPEIAGGTRTRSASAGTVLILFAQLMLMIDANIVQVALPHIRTDLHFTASSLLWVVSAYTLPYGGLLLLGGRLGDIRGRRRLFVIGLTLFTAGSLLGGLAPTAAILIAARAGQGVGAALTAPGVLALLTVNAPDGAARNRAFALFAAVTSGGMVLGQVLGGLITQAASWRWTLLINVPIGIVVILLAPRFIAESDRRASRLDIVGAITATLGSIVLLWTLVETPDYGWVSAPTLLGLTASAGLLAVFARGQIRGRYPMIDTSLLRSLPRTAALGVSLMVIGAQMAAVFFSVQFLQSLGLDPLQTGLAFLPMSAAVLVMSRLAPKLVQRFGAVRLVLFGTVLQTIALILLALRVGAGHDYFATAFTPLLLDGVALGSVLMPVTSLALASTPTEQAGSMSSILQMSQQLGAAIGLAVVVTVYASAAVPGQFVPGARGAFLTAALLSALAFLAAAAIAIHNRNRAAR